MNSRAGRDNNPDVKPGASNLRCLLFCFAWALLSPITGAADSKPPADLRGWHLVWNDEFDGQQIDLSKWRVENAGLFKNKELEYYSEDDAYVHDGLLTLRSQKRSMGGREYTSGLVETRGRFSRKFGRFEVRAKLPKGRGIWPAHWMLPENGRWPPEIDIIELLGHDPKKIHMTVHWGTYPAVKRDSKSFSGPDFSRDFHVFAIEWEPKEVRWFVDGKKKFSTSAYIPQEPFFLILNTAVGGDWPGNPDRTTAFPQYHDIDYVRVYAKEIPGTCLLDLSSPHGRIERNPPKDRYAQNSTVSLEAVPDFRYRFSHWSGDLSGTANPVPLTMNTHKKVAAVFDEDPDAPKLLSGNKPISASTVENSGCPASNAVDGNPRTRWSSQFYDPQWLSVDLEETRAIDGVRLVWETGYGREYEIQVSDDGQNWKKVYYTAHGKGQIEEITGLKTEGRYVRYYGTARGTAFGHSLWEFEVYGK